MKRTLLIGGAVLAVFSLVLVSNASASFGSNKLTKTTFKSMNNAYKIGSVYNVKSNNVNNVVSSQNAKNKKIIMTTDQWNKSLANRSNQKPLVSSTIPASRISPGLFGGHASYSFPGDLVIKGSYLNILSYNNPGILLGRYASITYDSSTGLLTHFSEGGHYFNANVGIGTTNPDATLRVNGTLKANYYVAYNGKYGITGYYYMKSANNNKCKMGFTNGLLTYSNCQSVQGR